MVWEPSIPHPWYDAYTTACYKGFNDCSRRPKRDNYIHLLAKLIEAKNYTRTTLKPTQTKLKHVRFPTNPIKTVCLSFLDLFVSSLRSGHAILLCMVPVLSQSWVETVRHIIYTV